MKKLRDIIENIWLRFDRDRSGYLDRYEAKDFVKTILGQMRVHKDSGRFEMFYENLFNKIDKDRSGKISKYEMTLFLK